MPLRLVQSQELTFEDFWRIYPRKIAKKDALAAWAKLTNNDQIACLQAIPAHTAYWRDRGDIQYVPYPATFIRGRRWEDELTSSLDPRPCRWTGCKRAGTQERGQGFYCEGHIAALNRGETATR